MKKIVSKTIVITSETMPPKSEFIEREIINHGINPIRWAIVEVNENKLTLNVSGDLI